MSALNQALEHLKNEVQQFTEMFYKIDNYETQKNILMALFLPKKLINFQDQWVELSFVPDPFLKIQKADIDQVMKSMISEYSLRTLKSSQLRAESRKNGALNDFDEPEKKTMYFLAFLYEEILEKKDKLSNLFPNKDDLVKQLKLSIPQDHITLWEADKLELLKIIKMKRRKTRLAKAGYYAAFSAAWLFEFLKRASIVFAILCTIKIIVLAISAIVAPLTLLALAGLFVVIPLILAPVFYGLSLLFFELSRKAKTNILSNGIQYEQSRVEQIECHEFMYEPLLCIAAHLEKVIQEESPEDVKLPDNIVIRDEDKKSSDESNELTQSVSQSVNQGYAMIRELKQKIEERKIRVSNQGIFQPNNTLSESDNSTDNLQFKNN